MSTEKFDAINHFVSITKTLQEMVAAIPDALKNGTTSQDIMLSDAAVRLELVHAAQAVISAPSDPEAAKAVGAVLLQRIELATTARSAAEWEACANEALQNDEPNQQETVARITRWLDMSQPVVDLAFETMQRCEEQNQAMMVESLRRAAEQTPGTSLRITEIVGDTVISDETVLGPEAGHEDSEGHSVRRAPASVKNIFGLDDDRMETDIRHLITQQAPLALRRNNLPPNAQEEQVRLAVWEQMLSKMDRDLEIVRVTGDLPSPWTDLNPGHFPALRAQLLLQHSIPLGEGPTLSRAQRGDRSARGLMRQLVVLAHLLSSAEPYYLPLAQLDKPAVESDLVSLPAESSFLIWHDTTLLIAGDVEVLAWLFATDDQGQLHPIVHAIRILPDGALESSWCSLRQGQAAQVAQRVGRSLRRPDWETARPLHLPRPRGGQEWKKALPRSAARLKEGAAHGLRTLP